MFEIKRYTVEREAEWNDFVSRSKNGTFLINRRYMDYHSDRFKDFSLMFYTGEKLYALLPANIKDGVLYSHQGLTYGGLIMDEKARAANVCVLMDEMSVWLRHFDIRKVVYKPAPWIYSSIPAEEDLYAITNICHANLTGREISSTINLNCELKFSELRRRGIKKAQKAGVEVRESNDIAIFWQILDNNLENKYGVRPVHTAEELKLLKGRFPNNIRLFMAYIDDESLGGVVTYQNRGTVHVQYISASPEGKRIGALDMIFDELTHNVFTGQRYFDFGKSTEKGGAYLNGNLIHQKEGFGARGVCYDTYEWDL